MRTQLIFRALVAAVVAVLFLVAGRSQAPAPANDSQVATQSVAAVGDTAHR